MLQQDHRPAVATTLLERLDATQSDEFVDTIYEVLSTAFAMRHAWVYVVDYGENYLRPLPTKTAPPPPRELLAVREGIAGEVISTREPKIEEGDRSVVWLPISQRGEAVGVLCVRMREPADVKALLDIASGLTVALGAAIVGARRRYDLLEATRGAPDLTLEAAIQWSVLAPTIHEEPELQVAARVEPSTEHGGDAWDFSLHEGALSFALFDAVGHGIDAANLSALAISTYRWSRRRGDPLPATVTAMDAAVARYGPGDDAFVTALICELGRESGTVDWVCAGHPPPIVITADAIEVLAPDERIRPLGLGGDVFVNRKQLSADSVLVLYSDGVVESTDGVNERYALQRLEQVAAAAIRSDRRLPVAVRSILDDVVTYADRRLADDATLFAIRWAPRPSASSRI